MTTTASPQQPKTSANSPWAAFLSPRRIWLALGLLALLVAGGTLYYLYTAPADWLITETVGLDKYEAHQPFAGETIIRQTIQLEANTLSRLDVLIVDLKQQSNLAPITLTLADIPTDEVIRQVTVPGTKVRDDYYLPFKFDTITNTAGREFSLSLSSAGATIDAPYAIRRTADNSLAYRTYRETTQAFITTQWLSQHRQQTTAFAVSLLISLAALWLIPRSRSTKTKYFIALLALTILLGSLLQTNVLVLLAGDPGGDAYYYLGAAKILTEGTNPLTIKTFRLPLYPLFLTPAILPAIPDLLWGRILGVIATVGLGLAIIMLVSGLGFRPIVGVAALALLYLNSDFIITSVRPRPHHLYTFFLVFSIALLFRVKSTRQAVLWGIVLGLMGMTRQEAYLPIAIMGLAYLIMLIARKTSPGKIMRLVAAVAIPLLLITSTYFYESFRQLGNPFDSDHFHRNTGQQALSLREFWTENSDLAKQKLTTAWLPSSESGLRKNGQGQLLLTIGVLLIIYLGQHSARWYRGPPSFIRRWYLPELASGLFSLALIVTLYQWALAGGRDWSQEINLIIIAAAVIGLLEILRVGRWRGLVVLSILLSQLLIATWQNPLPRLFQQTFPFFAIGIAALLLPWTSLPTVTRTKSSTLATWRLTVRVAPLVLTVTLLGAVSLTNLDVAIDKVNYPAAAYFVATTVAEQLANYPGTGAVEVDYTIGDGIYRLHSYQQHLLEPFEEDLTPAQQVGWLCENNISYLVDHDDLNRFTVIHDSAYQNQFEFLFEQKTVGRYDRRWRVAAYEFTGLTNCP
ncbi:hypothetical protein IH781_00955 [Patescibacteria group bacterium]|nr:hypothetical protein [Patescibacteria group bacterium]